VVAAETKEPLFTPRFLRLWAFCFITFFSAMQLFPTIPFRIIELGGTKAEAGLFLAVYTWASAVSAPLTGTIADHLGRRRVLIVAALAFIVFSLLYGWVTHLPALLLIACVHGSLWSALLSSASAIISEIIPFSRRTEGLAWWGMAPTAAIAVAPAVGLAVMRFGWATLCLEMAGLSVVIVILATMVRGGRERSAAPFPRLSGIVEWRVLVAATTMLAVSFGYGGITSYVAILATERGIVPPSLFFTVAAIAIIATRVVAAPIGDRFGPAMLLVPCLALVPFSHGFLAFASSRTAIVIAAIFFGVGLGGAYPAFSSWILGRTDPDRRASTFGSVLFSMDAGIGTGSILIGWIAEQYGFTQAFAAAGAVSIFAVPIFFATSRMLTFADEASPDSAVP